ncbi:Roundabout 2, partial [Xenotaenia resolanae]
MAKAQLEVADASKGLPPPIIRQGPSNQTQALGGVSVLKCQASGDPEPTVTWRKNGANLLGQDPRFSLLEHGSLQIQNTRLSDSGLYTCVATSSSGETSWSAYLDVRDSTDLMDFMSHNTTALPGPPSKPEVTDVTKSSISLSWEPGPEAGSPVSSYVIEAFGQSVSNSWQTVADHVKTTEFTVKDLRPNTVYLFIIRAVNAQGLGDPSPMSEPVRTQDISPTVQGVDHRRVQKELGDVVVNMHNPVVLSSTSVQVTWT